MDVVGNEPLLGIGPPDLEALEVLVVLEEGLEALERILRVAIGVPESCDGVEVVGDHPGRRCAGEYNSVHRGVVSAAPEREPAPNGASRDSLPPLARLATGTEETTFKLRSAPTSGYGRSVKALREARGRAI